MSSFLLALQFLTRIPVPFGFTTSDRQLGLSVLYYPLIGLIVGALLALATFLFQGLSANLQCALLLTLWVLLTGGLHLDGLADCADAWVGGFGDKEKSLAIMKDPAAGPVAVMVLVLTLLLKWSAMQGLAFGSLLIAVVAAPVLGRSAILALMLTTPYVRKKGMGESLVANLPEAIAKILLLAITLIAFFELGPLPLLLAGFVIIWIRYTALRRLGGMTGDVYGAAVELVELAVLLGVALNG